MKDIYHSKAPVSSRSVHLIVREKVCEKRCMNSIDKYSEKNTGNIFCSETQVFSYFKTNQWVSIYLTTQTIQFI